MKSAFFAGYGRLGFRCLSLLRELDISVQFVLTHPDMGAESVDDFCKRNDIEFSYLDLRKDISAHSGLFNQGAKYLISVNYRFILPEFFLRKFQFPINLHGSLLPKYRGRTPHVWAIINGENKTGVTCHIMESTVDTGAILSQVEVEILDEDTGATLLEKFEKLYPSCLKSSINIIENGLPLQNQNHELATYFGKRIPEMGVIDFSKSSKSLINFIRAQAKPYPGAYCFLGNGQKLVVHKAVIVNTLNDSFFEIGMIKKIDKGYMAKVSDGYLLFSETELIEN